MTIVKGLFNSGRITLDVKPRFWTIHEYKKIPSFWIPGFVNCDGVQKRIIIECSFLYGPDGLPMNVKSLSKEHSTGTISIGDSNDFQCSVEDNLPYQYILLGRVGGQTPILIAYYINSDIAFYTFDLTLEGKLLFKDLN